MPYEDMAGARHHLELEGRELAVHCLDRSFSKGMAGGDFVKLLHRIEEVAL